MATNLVIDDRLLNEARKIEQYPTKKSTVNSALKEYIHRRREQEIIDLFGKIEYDPDYNYKQARQR